MSQAPGRSSRRRERRGVVPALAGMLAVLLLVSGCVARPARDAEVPGGGRDGGSPPPNRTLIVTLDDLGAGFNPHLRSDLGESGRLLADLTLPSAFTERPGGGGMRMNDALLVSADVVRQAPFTVRYEVVKDAQWSDHPQSPIEMRDFRFLWERMRDTPGVVDPGGYRLITDIRPVGAGGKVFDVVFSTPYPEWRRLFSHLLPAHVLGGEGGFVQETRNPLVSAGGRYRVESADLARGEIDVVVNDKYWVTKPGSQPVIQAIKLRRSGTTRSLTQGLRSDLPGVAVIHAPHPRRTAVEAIGGVRTATLARPRSMAMTVAPGSRRLAGIGAREFVFSSLDVRELGTVATDGQVPGTREDLDPLGRRSGPREIAAVEATKPTGTVVIGVAAGDSSSVLVANMVADVLRGRVDVEVEALDRDELHGARMLDGSVDLVIGWEDTGSPVGAMFDARFGCTAIGDAIPGGMNGTAAADLCVPAIQEGTRALASSGTAAEEVVAEPLRLIAERRLALPIVADVVFVAVGAKAPVPVAPGTEPGDAGFVTTPSSGVFVDVASWGRS